MNAIHRNRLLKLAYRLRNEVKDEDFSFRSWEMCPLAHGTKLFGGDMTSWNLLHEADKIFGTTPDEFDHLFTYVGGCDATTTRKQAANHIIRFVRKARLTP